MIGGTHSIKDNVVINEFDQKAEHYESNRLAQWYQAHAQEITTRCPEMEVGDILDIGCATGYQLRLLAKTYPNVRLVGLDISPQMIRQAQLKSAQCTPEIHFMADDWENLDSQSIEYLKQFRFKLIICANTFHYFTQPRQAIAQIYSMLDSGGMLLILEREKSSSVLTTLWGFLHRHYIKDQVEFYAAEDITGYLSEAGFENISIVRTIKRYFWKGKLFTSISIIKGNKLNDK